MRRVGNLQPLIADRDNLRRAFLKAARGKSGKPEVIAFRETLDEQIENLRHRILTLQPMVGNYRFFYVRDPKIRLICAAAFPERVLQHAIMNVCEPILDASAIYHSYACRKGKGMHRAIRYARRCAAKHKYYLKLDIRKYFDSICHQTALCLLESKIKDKQTLALFAKIMAQYQTRPGRGKHQLFIRPRRFGKSLLLSMLANYYDVARQDQFENMFGRLAISRRPTPLKNHYFILRWDFSCVDPMGTAEQIKRALHDHINACIKRFAVRYLAYLQR